MTKTHSIEPSARNLRSALFPLSLFMLLLCPLPLTQGCGEDAAPEATLVLYHDLAEQGDLDILVNGDRLTYVAPGRFSARVGVPLGLSKLAIRSSGASEPLLDPVDVDFQLQGYFFSIHKIEGERTLIAVKELPPEREEGLHHVEVLNLLEPGEPLDYWIGEEELRGAKALPLYELSTFETVSAGEAPFGMTNPETGAPVKLSSPFSLSEGGASLFVIYSKNDSVEIQRFEIR